MDVQFNQRPGSMEVWDYGLSADAGHMSGSHVCPDPEGHDTLACRHATVEDTVIQYKELS